AGDAGGGGSLSPPPVVAADVRLAEPGSELEAQLGDGAACAAVGHDGLIAELVSAASIAEEFTYLWRTDEQRYVQVADARFGNQYGVAGALPGGVGAALGRAERPRWRVAKLCLAVPDSRAAADVAKRIGCDPKSQLQPDSGVGVLGTPEPLVLLSNALETAAPGDFLVVAAYGEGAEALVLRAPDALPQHRPEPLTDRLANRLAPPSYQPSPRAPRLPPPHRPAEPGPP